jgi:hypothetical protein
VEPFLSVPDGGREGRSPEPARVKGRIVSCLLKEDCIAYCPVISPVSIPVISPVSEPPEVVT